MNYAYRHEFLMRIIIDIEIAYIVISNKTTYSKILFQFFDHIFLSQFNPVLL